MSILLQTDDQKRTFEFLGKKRFDKEGKLLLVENDLSKSKLVKEFIDMMSELAQIEDFEKILQKYWVGFSIKCL